TVVREAHREPSPALSQAQALLIERYGRAVYRYLLAALRDPAAADDVFQEFALLLVRGSFKRVSPEKGRFRDYVKTVLFHLVAEHRRRQQKVPRIADSMALAAAAAPAGPSEDELEFRDRWRDELLAKAWEALEQHQRDGGGLYHTLLYFHTTHPGLDSAAMARQLSEQLGRPLTAGGVRQTIRRARERFADFLIDELARSLETDDLDAVAQEAADLGLHSYCADVLQKRRG